MEPTTVLSRVRLPMLIEDEERSGIITLHSNQTQLLIHINALDAPVI